MIGDARSQRAMWPATIVVRASFTKNSWQILLIQDFCSTIKRQIC